MHLITQRTTNIASCETFWQRASKVSAAPTVVHADDVQAVEELPLVLVDPLHMDVKHGGRVHFYPVFFLQVLGKFHLVVLWEEIKKKVNT